MEESGKNKKRNNNTLLYIIIINIIILIGIIFGYLIHKNNNKTPMNDNYTNINEVKHSIKKLDKIDSSGVEVAKENVENIYNNIAYSTIIMCNHNNFYVSNSSDEEKLQIVFDSFYDFQRVDNELENKIYPKNIVIDGLNYKLEKDALLIDREKIENKFYEIFGNEYVFNNNIPISLCGSEQSKFIYNNKLDVFVAYSNDGSPCSCAWGGSVIYKAYKKDNKLKIYTITSGEEEVDSVYTFNFKNDKYFLTY